MKVAVLLATKQNNLVSQKLKALMNKDDRLLIFDVPKFPARKLDEILWREIPNQDTLVIMMNPNTIDVEADFVEVFRMFLNSPNDVLIRSPLESFEGFYPEKALNKVRSSDCVAFHRAMYKRQFTDISPHADFATCIKEIVRSCGKGIFYIPQRSDSKLKETQNKEEVKIIEDQQNKRRVLMEKLDDIRRKRKLREEEKSRKVEQISRLQYELSQLEVEIRTNEAYLKQQENEIEKLERASIEEYKDKEKILADVQEKIKTQSIKIEQLRTRIENGDMVDILSSLDEKRIRDEREASDFQKKKKKQKEELVKEEVKRASAKKRINDPPHKKAKIRELYITDDPQTRKIVLSEVPKTKETLIGVTLIDWE